MIDLGNALMARYLLFSTLAPAFAPASLDLWLSGYAVTLDTTLDHCPVERAALWRWSLLVSSGQRQD